MCGSVLVAGDGDDDDDDLSTVDGESGPSCFESAQVPFVKLHILLLKCCYGVGCRSAFN
jgi:hypothetical protein